MEHWRVAMRGLKESSLHGTGAGTYGDEWVGAPRLRRHGGRRALAVRRDAGRARDRRLRAHRRGLLGACSSAWRRCGAGPTARLRGAVRGGAGVGGPRRGRLGLGDARGDAAGCSPSADSRSRAVTTFPRRRPGPIAARDSPASPRWRSRSCRRWCFVSQVRIDSAVSAYKAERLPTAIPDARSSASVLDGRTQPHEIAGVCLSREGEYAAGVASLERAVGADPNNWRAAHDAVDRAGRGGRRPAAGGDPRPALAPARPITKQNLTRFDTEPQGGVEAPRPLARGRPAPDGEVLTMADDATFERLYTEHAAALLGFLVYRTGDRTLAEDILADTFERVLTARRGFDRRRASEKTWLYTIALNRLRDLARRRRRGARARARRRPRAGRAGRRLVRAASRIATSSSARSSALPEDERETRRAALRRRPLAGRDRRRHRREADDDRRPPVPRPARLRDDIS